jgi:amino acid transporter
MVVLGLIVLLFFLFAGYSSYRRDVPKIRGPVKDPTAPRSRCVPACVDFAAWAPTFFDEPPPANAENPPDGLTGLFRAVS